MLATSQATAVARTNVPMTIRSQGQGNNQPRLSFRKAVAINQPLGTQARNAKFQ